MATMLDTTLELDLSPGTIRTWARANGYLVATMGMVPRDVVNAYLVAHGETVDERAKVARPSTSPQLPEPAPAPAPAPVTFQEPAVTPSAAPATPEADAGELEGLRAQLERLTKERDRLQRGGAELGRQVERYLTWVLDATAMHDLIDEEGDGDWQLVWERLAELRPELEQVRAELAQQREENAGHLRKIARLERALDLPLLPEPIADLLNAWHRLFEKASRVETEAGHTIAELALPALVTETADHVHDLIRLLDGDVSR